MKLESEFSADHSMSIQAQGALLAVDERSEQFLFGSENAHRFADVSRTSELFGRTIREVLGREITHALRNAETMPSLDRRRQHIGQFDLSGTVCDMSVFRVGSSLVLEATRKVGDHVPSAYDVMKDVEVFSDVLLSCGDLEKQIQRFVALMRTMSGYHCVSLEQRNESGVLHTTTSGRDSLAGSHCEGKDQLHFVYDVDAPSVGLAVDDGIEVPPLDMSALRVPSDDCLSSCRSTGVAALASIGLRWGGRLQGTLKFLHATPRVPNKRTQLAVAHLAPLIGQRLSSLI